MIHVHDVHTIDLNCFACLMFNEGNEDSGMICATKYRETESFRKCVKEKVAVTELTLLLCSTGLNHNNGHNNGHNHENNSKTYPFVLQRRVKKKTDVDV